MRHFHTKMSSMLEQPIARELLGAVEHVYGRNLVACSIFGSYARGTQTPESDLDLLIVADNLPDGRMKRVSEFTAVESMLRDSDLAHIDLSPIIKSQAEADAGSPLFWDMTDYAIVLFDRGSYLQTLLNRVRERLRRLGAQRIQKGNAWYWVLKKDFVPGEVFEV